MGGQVWPGGIVDDDDDTAMMTMMTMMAMVTTTSLACNIGDQCKNPRNKCEQIHVEKNLGEVSQGRTGGKPAFQKK